jgi:sarcosine oxidase delta subunit
MSGYLPITCPICRSRAEQLDRIIDGDAIRCRTHGEFEFTGTARNEKSRDREDWEKALERAKTRTAPGRRPRIYSTDF